MNGLRMQPKKHVKHKWLFRRHRAVPRLRGLPHHRGMAHVCAVLSQKRLGHKPTPSYRIVEATVSGWFAQLRKHGSRILVWQKNVVCSYRKRKRLS